ncbi:MAG: hypothetical protein CMP12_14375 [Zunongwangia sp.]|uniref:Uncharacterized protein n=2 Tax=Zunongwangia profunda TaxID=398743 RepID=D5BAJ6_ZUNPS|nr:hypothetical protein [Zunongwangia profunda]MAC64336.1 hypothetical protein [Flavobacteriaceae bacterium]MAO37059.1 hypothetical protein [Zunongwangia sp.]ADF54522.1 hypothetical protein ZPR_4219 [Zunongwangia profunda SM-A87]MAC65041.1 hypothetical protein [Flavobacteriaceae bacterium]MAG86533.1 hypothetical protein [Flavobacteriaceae bacterium]
MKLIYTGAHLKVYNMVSRSNQIINSAHFYEDLKGFLDQHYNENVVAEFLKRLKNSNFEIKVSSHWKPFSKRFIYIDKSGISINSALLHRPSKFYIALFLEKAFLIFDQKYDISNKTLMIKNFEEKEDVLQGIGYLAATVGDR